jgi:transcriptional regulator with XRE-family HTH domain
MKKSLELHNLKALLRYKNISYGELSEYVGISKGAFSDKMNNSGGRSFNTPEIIAISEYLGLDKKDIPRYFFDFELE